MDWITSLAGIITVTLGSFSLASLMTNAVSSIKNISSSKKIMNLSGTLQKSEKLLEQSVETNKALVEKNNEKEEIIARMELERLETSETDKLILTALSYIVSAAGGIDDVTKIQLITEMDKAKKKIEEKYLELKEASEKRAKEIIDELEKKKSDLLTKTAGVALEFLDDAKEKAEEVINKHANR